MDNGKKAVLIICDGIADRPIVSLKDQTPLEAARTPNLDELSRRGISGLMNTIGVGIRPGSDTAHLAIFGYDPEKYYSGRGPFECLGIGMDVRPGDVAFRANAGTIENGLVTDRRAGRIKDTSPLVDILADIEIDGIKFILKPSLGHRVGLMMRGPGLSSKVSDQDPHETGVSLLEVKPLDDTKEAAFTAGILNKFSGLVEEKLATAEFNDRRKAEQLPEANCLLFRGAGSLPENLPNFEERFNLRTAFAAGGPLYKGVALSVGMDLVEYSLEDGVTGLPDSNLNNKIRKALMSLEDHDLLIVHIKAADSLAEDGNAPGKTSFIEKIDSALSPLLNLQNTYVAITADHTTSCELKKHTADPVPVLISGPSIRTDGTARFTERACGQGSLKINRGLDLMPLLIDCLGKAKLYGA